MSPLNALAGRFFEWTQPHALRQEYELRDGETPVATVAFRSAFGTMAAAEWGAKKWTFKRVGFWQQKVSVRVDGSEIDVATYVNDTWNSGGELRFPDGRAWRGTSNFWSTKFAWHDGSDAIVAAMEHSGFLRLHSKVTVPETTGDDVPVELLVMLGLYIVVMLQRESAAGAAVVAAG